MNKKFKYILQQEMIKEICKHENTKAVLRDLADS